MRTTRRPYGFRRGLAALVCTAAASSAQGQVTYREHYSVGPGTATPHELGSVDAVALGPDLRLYVGQARRVEVFDSTGYVNAIGAGAGGEVSALGVTPDGDTVVVYDHPARRVVFVERSGRISRSFALPFQPEGRLNMLALRGGGFLFVGPVAGHAHLAHRVGPDGAAHAAFGELVPAGDGGSSHPLIRAQMAQGWAAELPDGDVVLALHAPYVLARFSPEGEMRWQIRDSLLPDPRERHIVASETAYRVSPYPQVTDVHALTDGMVQVLAADFESETRTEDIRRASDGALVSRRTFPFSVYPWVMTRTGPAAGHAVISSLDPVRRLIVASWTAALPSP